jgi:nicotinamide phosphoribosyltransferase
MSGAGHLLFFTGTDTIPAIDFLEDYYDAYSDFVGGSVAATEHSVMCAGGDENERETFERLLELYPNGIVSVVSDTWDLWNVLTNIVPSLKDRILAREGKLVIRPDSGDPVKIIVGDELAPVGSPERKGVIELLWDTFGGVITDKGYKLLDSHIGAIYGDSITYDRLNAILDGLEKKGFASANMVFGIGSFSYQYVTRDTYGFAMKATEVEINGVSKPIFKDPVTDGGLKKSAKGRLSVISEGGTLVLMDEADEITEAKSILRPVWRNGEFIHRYTLAEVRANAKASL